MGGLSVVPDKEPNLIPWTQPAREVSGLPKKQSMTQLDKVAFFSYLWFPERAYATGACRVHYMKLQGQCDPPHPSASFSTLPNICYAQLRHIDLHLANPQELFR